MCLIVICKYVNEVYVIMLQFEFTPKENQIRSHKFSWMDGFDDCRHFFKFSLYVHLLTSKHKQKIFKGPQSCGLAILLSSA